MIFSFEEYPEPIICPEYPWEGNMTYLYGSVVKVDGKYRMYYQTYVDGLGYFVCFAESMDGIRWYKPLLRPLEDTIAKIYPTVEIEGMIKTFYKETRGLNTLSNVISTYHIPSVIYKKGEKYPYKLFGYTDRGFCVAFSKDGVNFKEYEKNPVISLRKYPNKVTGKVWYSDVAPVFYDERKNIYRAMIKTYKVDEKGRTRRCIGMSTSKDFIVWDEPRTIWVPSSEEDKMAKEEGFSWVDFYGLCPFNYRDSYLGLLWLFFIKEEIPNGTHRGKIQVYLVRSSNCINWEFVSNEPLIKLSGWHNGLIYTANQPFKENEETFRIYFSGFNFDHGKIEAEKLGAGEKACIGFGVLRYYG